MDDLPELKSDADVDALMTRLRAKVAATSSPSTRDDASTRASTQATHDDDAIEQELASVIARAMNVMADSLGDLEAEIRSLRTARKIARAAKTPVRRKRR